ncbi:MAG: aromatic-ring-hydroxylating dioxygenase subunit beta [Burkholderiales bacterium]
MERNADNSEKAATKLVYRSCLLLDEKKFDEYLALCEEDFHYTITAYSPEVRAEMIWMDEDKVSLKKMLGVLPRHNSEHSPLSRHVTVYTVDYDDDKQEAFVVSALQVFKTSLDGGETNLFAVAKFYDTIKLNNGKARFLTRNVRLDTRMLGLGSHIPL